MKKLVSAVVFCGLLVSPLANLSAAQDKPFFDMENCGMCKNMSAEKGLVENMQWELHAIANGMLSVTTVAEGYEEALARSEKKMQENGLRLMKGEKMELCGYCQSFGLLMMTGAKMENVESKAGHFMLVTSDNADVIKQIHAHVKRSNAEYAKMLESHEGHDHGSE